MAPLLILADGTICYEAYRFVCGPEEYAHKSPAWWEKAVRYIGALHDFYLCAYGRRALAEEEARNFFGEFVKALMYGTTGRDGVDPTGLNWSPWPWPKVGHATYIVRRFSDFCGDYFDHTPFAPSSSEWLRSVVVAYGLEQRRFRSKLMHLGNRRRIQPQPLADFGQRKRASLTDLPTVRTFPREYIRPLIFEGCRRVRASSEFKSGYPGEFNVMVQIALVLLAGGGIRMSELFNLHVDDIRADHVRLYHPEQGRARWQSGGKFREGTRTEFLADVYGRVPRTKMTRDKEYVGWKNMLLEDTKKNYSIIHWLDTEFGSLFKTLHRIYLREIRPKTPHHPYYFVSLDRDNFGSPWTANAFRQAFNDALRRIGLEPNRHQGLNPHGLRHHYGQCLVDMGLPAQKIQYCLHHTSILSQEVYTRPTPGKIDEALRKAAERFDRDDLSTFAELDGEFWKSDRLNLFSPWGGFRQIGKGDQKR
jgi:integrase